MFDVIVPPGSPGNFIQQPGVLFNRRMRGIAAGFIQMFTRADIIGLVKVAYARCLQFQALFHTAERQPLTGGIKSIGPGGYQN